MGYAKIGKYSGTRDPSRPNWKQVLKAKAARVAENKLYSKLRRCFMAGMDPELFGNDPLLEFAQWERTEADLERREREKAAVSRVL